MMEEVRVQVSWGVSIVDSSDLVSKLLQAIDYSLNGDQMIQTIFQGSKLTSIRRVSFNCMIIEIFDYILEKHYAYSK